MVSTLALLVLGAVPTVDWASAKPVSPHIFGANFPDWANVPVKFPFARSGGNRLTAYNWENNASNAGSDWYNENDEYMGVTNEAGWAQRTFLQGCEAGGAKAVLLTVQTAGYVAADKSPHGDVNGSPDYIHTRFKPVYPSKPGGAYVYPPSPTDNAVYSDEFVHWIMGVKQPTTTLFFSLDNEPDLWNYTHSRIVPSNVGYAGILQNNIDYAKGIKSAAPGALVFGPASYGYYGYVRFQGAADANNRDFLDFYLAGMKQAEAANGKRLLDVLDLHWYPEAQGDGHRITDDGDTAGERTARVMAPRSLWDATYVETSWIAQDYLGNKPINLIPSLKAKIDAQYPGTKLAFTEYNYGGSASPSGMVAQADVLGVFAQQGVFAASNWGLGSGSTAQIAGFRAWLDYDGKGSQAGDQIAPVTGVDPAKWSIYPTKRADGKLVFVVVNKLEAAQTLPVPFRAGKLSRGRAFLANFAHPTLPTPVPVRFLGDRASVTLPPLSVCTVELTP